MNPDKFKLFLGVAVMIMAIAGIGAWLYMTNIRGEAITLPEIGTGAIVIFLVLGAAKILWDKWQAMKSGLPAEDERYKLVNWKAGYYAFLAAIWGSLGISMFSDLWPELTVSQALSAVILLTGSAFVIAFLILHRRGD